MSRLSVCFKTSERKTELRRPHRGFLLRGWGNAACGLLLLALTFISMGFLTSCGDSNGTPAVFTPTTGTTFTVSAALTTPAGAVATGTPVSLTGVGTSSTVTPITAIVGANGAVSFLNVATGTYVITIPGVGNSSPINVSANAPTSNNIVISPNNPSPGQYCPSTTPGTGNQPPGAPACLPVS